MSVVFKHSTVKVLVCISCLISAAMRTLTFSKIHRDNKSHITGKHRKYLDLSTDPGKYV